MKTTRAAGFLALFLCTLIACRKDLSIDGQPPVIDSLAVAAGQQLVRIQGGINPDLNNDTIYRITYNPSKKIATLIDSIYYDTLKAGYDVSGNLTSITENGPYAINALFKYDASGALTQVNYRLAGSSEQYTFEYTNGVVSKKSYSSDLGRGGTVSLKQYYTYAFTGGNITDIKAYTAAGAFISETKLTYGTQDNPFKALSLFNYANRLGLDNIVNFETYFNKNILTAFTINGQTALMTNSFNNQKQVFQIVSNDNINDWLLTWRFSYK